MALDLREVFKGIKPPGIVSEVLNAHGSHAFRKALERHDEENLVKIARKQVAAGAQGLDLHAFLEDENQEKKDLIWLLEILKNEVAVPFFIDSRSPAVIRAGIASLPHRTVINSIPAFPTETRDQLLALAQIHQNPCVLSLIDQEGPAVIQQKKLTLAQELFHQATTTFGLKPQQLIFDVMVFPQAKYPHGIAETLAMTTLVKKHFPQAWTLAAISNVSYGLSPGLRGATNAKFFKQIQAHKLDLALLNPTQLP